MTQAELLSSAQLHLNENVRRSAAQAGCVLLRTAGGEHRLVLTPAQAAILTDGFAQPATASEVLARLLGEHRCPPLSEYYELVVRAHAAGVLVTGLEPTEYSLARGWRVRLPLRAAGIAASAVVVLGLLALVVAPWRAPGSWPEVALGWLVACALLSVGEALAACALASGGCEVRSPRFHWQSLLPHFRVDTGEAAMGGRECELAVAALRAAPLAAGAAALAWQLPEWLAPLLAGLLYVLAPWGGSAAAHWLRARRGRPQFSVHSGAAFDADQEDAWADWRAWWSSLEFKLALGWLGWIVAWCVLLGAAMARCLPGWSAAILARFGPAGGLRPLLAVFFYSLAATVAIALLAVMQAALRHWRLQRQWSKPLRSTVTGEGARSAMQGEIPDVLRSLPLFASLADEDLATLAQAMQVVQFEKKQEVFCEDDPGDAFYVILAGQLEILKRRPKSRRAALIGLLGPGDGFGEIALLENTVRTATARAAGPSRLLRLAKEDFARLVVGRIGTARVREILQHATFLGRLVFLAGWPFADLVRYAQRCNSVRFAAGVQVLKKGEPNLWFYLIFDGAFEARDGERVLRRMQPGDYFGEISLLEHGYATADVVALEESRCLTLARDDFLTLFAQDFRIGLRMESLAAERLGTRLFASR